MCWFSTLKCLRQSSSKYQSKFPFPFPSARSIVLNVIAVFKIQVLFLDFHSSLCSVKVYRNRGASLKNLSKQPNGTEVRSRCGISGSFLSLPKEMPSTSFQLLRNATEVKRPPSEIIPGQNNCSSRCFG